MADKRLSIHGNFLPRYDFFTFQSISKLVKTLKNLIKHNIILNNRRYRSKSFVFMPLTRETMYHECHGHNHRQQQITPK